MAGHTRRRLALSSLVGRCWVEGLSSLGNPGTSPRHSGACCVETACEQAEERGVGEGRDEADADTGGLFDDAAVDLEEAQPQGCKFCAGEGRGPGNGVARGEHYPIGCGVYDEPELVGERALARRSIRGGLPLAHLDQVLGLAAGAVDVFVEMAGLASERDDDIAGFEGAGTRLQPGYDPAFAAPGGGGGVEFGEAAHLVRVGFGPAHLVVVGHVVCESVQRAVAGEAEVVLDPVPLAPGHGLCAAVVAVSPEDDPSVRPVAADLLFSIASSRSHQRSAIITTHVPG